MISSDTMFYSQSNHSLKKNRISLQIKTIRREEGVAITRGLSTTNLVSTGLIIISFLHLTGTCEWCYVAMQSTVQHISYVLNS